MNDFAATTTHRSAPRAKARPRRPRLASGARAIIAPIAVLFASLAPPSIIASEPDTSRTRTSDDGAFVVTIESRVEPIPLNAMHAWTVHVEMAHGEPVVGATFEIDGGMPMHDHGLPTAPRITEELGEGNYLLEGVKFQMPGHWIVSLAISAAGTTDSVTFELML